MRPLVACGTRGGRVPRLVSVCRAPGSPGEDRDERPRRVRRNPLTRFHINLHIPNSLRMHPHRPHRSASTRWCIPHQGTKATSHPTTRSRYMPTIVFSAGATLSCSASDAHGMMGNLARTAGGQRASERGIPLLGLRGRPHRRRRPLRQPSPGRLPVRRVLVMTPRRRQPRPRPAPRPQVCTGRSGAEGVGGALQGVPRRVRAPRIRVRGGRGHTAAGTCMRADRTMRLAYPGARRPRGGRPSRKTSPCDAMVRV